MVIQIIISKSKLLPLPVSTHSRVTQALTVFQASSLVIPGLKEA